MAIAKVRDGGTNSTKTSATTLAATVPAAGHAVGNLVVVFYAGIGGSNLAPSCADSRGNTYTSYFFGAAGGVPSAMFWSVLTTALLSGDTITVTPQATVPTESALNTTEFSGVQNVQDGSQVNGSQGSSATPSITAFTTTDATDLILGSVAANGPSGDTFTNDTATYDGSTWVALPRVGTTGGAAGSNATCNSAYLISSATGSVNYKPTITSRAWFEGVVALKAAAAAPALLPGQLHHRQPAFRGRPPSRGRFMVALPTLCTPRLWLPGAAV